MPVPSATTDGIPCDGNACGVALRGLYISGTCCRFPNGAHREAKIATVVAAIGWAVLETVRILGVSTRQPWNGKVDIDVEYKTMRPRFRELFRLENPPYPDSVSITARTADGELLPVRSLTKESPLDHGTYTVNRKTLQNGTALFSR